MTEQPAGICPCTEFQEALAENMMSVTGFRKGQETQVTPVAQNFSALGLLPQLTDEVMATFGASLGNKETRPYGSGEYNRR